MTDDDRPTVGVDIDGVVGSFMGIVREGLEETEGVELSNEEIKYDGWTRDDVGHSVIEAVDRTHENTWPDGVSTFPEDVAVIDGAREGIAAMAEECEIVMVTARPGEFYEGTKRWLEENDIPHDELRTTSEKGEEPDLDVLIDDHISHVRDFAATDRPAVVFDRSWSGQDTDVADLGPGDAVRVDGEDNAERWSKTVDAVAGLLRGEDVEELREAASADGLVDAIDDRTAAEDVEEDDGQGDEQGVEDDEAIF